MIEEWRRIPSAPDYEASSLGRVRSIDRVIETSNGQRRRYRSKLIGLSSRNQYGHRKVPLQVNRRRVLAYVHDVVAEAFHGPKPDGLEVAHGDGCVDNNRPGNLRYATPAENNADKRAHGTHIEGERHPSAQLTADQVRDIRRRVAAGEIHREIAADFPVSQQTVSDIGRHRSWRSLA